MENELKATTNKLLVDIDKCNRDEALFKLEFCKKGSNEIEKIIADIFSDAEETYENNKKMCLNLNQIIKLLKICEHKNIKSFCRDTFNKYKYVLENIIVQNDKAEVLFSDFMLLIHFFGCEDHHAYFMCKQYANFIIQNINQKFLNAVKENDNNIILTNNKICCDDDDDKLTPDKMILIRSKTCSYTRSSLDKWIWQQFIDSNWDLEQVFNFFKLNGDLYPMEPVTHSCFNNSELLDIDYIFTNEFHFSKELVNAIKKKMDLYAGQILSDEKTDYLTLEEIKVIAISNFNFIQNHELKGKFLNRIPKQIDFCYFRYFVSIFVRKELAEQNLIDQEFINSYMDRVTENSKYEKNALYKIKSVKADFEGWTRQATNLCIEECWERFKSCENPFCCKVNLMCIEDDLEHKFKSGTLDPDLADKIISEMPRFKNKDVQKTKTTTFFQIISGLIKAKRATYTDEIKIIDRNIKLECARDDINKQQKLNTNSVAPKVYPKNKDNTGRPWYVILGHILTLGIFLWGPLLFDFMFGCCLREPKETIPKEINVPITDSNNQLKTMSTTDTIAQHSMKSEINTDSTQSTKNSEHK